MVEGGGLEQQLRSFIKGACCCCSTRWMYPFEPEVLPQPAQPPNGPAFPARRVAPFSPPRSPKAITVGVLTATATYRGEIVASSVALLEPRLAHQFPDDLPLGENFLSPKADTNSVDLKVWAIAEVCFFAYAPSDCDRLEDLEIQDCFNPAATEVNEAGILSSSRN